MPKIDAKKSSYSVRIGYLQGRKSCNKSSTLNVVILCGLTFVIDKVAGTLSNFQGVIISPVVGLI